MDICKKCGSNSMEPIFKHLKEKIYWSEHNEISNLSEFTRNDRYYSSDEISKECLIYTCKTCNYKVAIKTKDA